MNQAKPDPPRSGPGGIARMAAASPLADERNDVRYHELPCRSVLNKCVSERPFADWTINPYRGCEFGCLYCYARYTHEYLELHGPEDFERRIFVKNASPAILAREIDRRLAAGHSVAIGTATDPYQPAERRFRVTRNLLEVLVDRAAGIDVGITTKSDLVSRDVDLLGALGRRNRVRVNVSITTVDARLARRLEPRAPTPRARLAAVAALRAAGIDAGVFAMPILPGINDRPDALDALVAAAAEAGAGYLAHQVLFLRAAARRRFLPVLGQEFPRLLAAYRRGYDEKGDAPAAYRHRIATLMDELRARHHLDRPPHDAQLPAEWGQLTLPFEEAAPPAGEPEARAQSGPSPVVARVPGA